MQSSQPGAAWFCLPLDYSTAAALRNNYIACAASIAVSLCNNHAAFARSIAVSLCNNHAAFAESIAVSLRNTHAACAEAKSVVYRKLPAKFGDLLSEDQLKEIEELGLLADLDDQVWIS